MMKKIVAKRLLNHLIKDLKRYQDYCSWEVEKAMLNLSKETALEYNLFVEYLEKYIKQSHKILRKINEKQGKVVDLDSFLKDYKSLLKGYDLLPWFILERF